MTATTRKTPLKKFILSLLTFCSLGFAKEAPYDTIISLGGTCEAAYQIQWLKLRQAAYPFDWCVTPIEGLCQFIETKASNFLERPNLTTHPRGIEDTFYHFLFLHDFNMKNSDPFSDYSVIKAKYNRRINRFFNALKSNQKILFIRVQITLEQVVHLDELIHSLYPNLTYTILAVDETEEISHDWGLERVKNICHKNLTDWPSALPKWQEILSQFKFSFKKTKKAISD